MSKIYQTDFLKRAQNLHHAGKAAGKAIEAHNPLCGDKQTIYLEVEDGIIKNISFEAQSCMVSKVATDLVAEQLIGQELKKANALQIDDIEQLLGAKLTPTRRKCATLGLSAIQDNL